MKDIVGTVHIETTYFAHCGCTTLPAHPPSEELRAPPREWSGWASTIVHPRRNVFIWTVPTISFTAAPPHELTLAHGRGGDCGRPKLSVEGEPLNGRVGALSWRSAPVRARSAGKSRRSAKKKKSSADTGRRCAAAPAAVLSGLCAQRSRSPALRASSWLLALGLSSLALSSLDGSTLPPPHVYLEQEVRPTSSAPPSEWFAKEPRSRAQPPRRAHGGPRDDLHHRQGQPRKGR